MRFRVHSLSLLLALLSVGASVPCALNCAGVFSPGTGACSGCCPEQSPVGNAPCEDPDCPGCPPSGPCGPSGAPCSPFLCMSWSCPLAPVDAAVMVDTPDAQAFDRPPGLESSALQPPSESVAGDADRAPPLFVVHQSVRRAISLLHPHAI